MGRNARRKARKKALETDDTSVNRSPAIIELRKWLKTNGYSNDAKLLLKDFKSTGRGVCSKRMVAANEFLIRMPYRLMITFTTLNSSEFAQLFDRANVKCEMQDVLALFLALERKKPDSRWKRYIDSLPDYKLPLCCVKQKRNLELLPANVRTFCTDWYGRFEESWTRIRAVASVDFDSYKWSYTMVNTRAVYVDPSVVMAVTKSRGLKLRFRLMDEPSMALCPFLDMFNHETRARTEARLSHEEADGEWFYTLRTQTSHSRHEQIFINYGPHSNEKLWLEYGFVLPKNDDDAVRFDFERDVLRSYPADERQYKFIAAHNFADGLSVSPSQGVSFNLKATIHVLRNAAGAATWNARIFGDDCERASVKSACKRLLELKVDEYKSDLRAMEEIVWSDDEDLRCKLLDLWMNKLDFVEWTATKW